MSNRQIAYIICVFVGLLFGAITYFSHHLFGNVFITWVCAIPVIAMLAAGGWFAFGDVRLSGVAVKPRPLGRRYKAEGEA